MKFESCSFAKQWSSVNDARSAWRRTADKPQINRHVAVAREASAAAVYGPQNAAPLPARKTKETLSGKPQTVRVGSA